MIALLFLVGFIGVHWKLFLTVALIAAAVHYGKPLYQQYLSDQEASRRRDAEIAARADQQHHEVLRGNEHGIFGDAWAAQKTFDRLTH
jgi:hypothetical protein